ncbi:MAG: hypothetical protein CML47_01400 [Rhodobacteraceae bacterium]|nr:MAG: hypothetical protein CML47_01400 [Paracoccaceae bacterium]|tara:strand:- start:12078 stop:12518 length:441 start_codon:yes stop_codon:yes gene_type:complete
MIICLLTADSTDAAERKLRQTKNKIKIQIIHKTNITDMLSNFCNCLGNSEHERETIARGSGPGPETIKPGPPSVLGGSRALRIHHEKARRSFTHSKRNNKDIKRIRFKYDYELTTEEPKKKRKSFCEKASKFFKKSKPSTKPPRSI